MSLPSVLDNEDCNDTAVLSYVLSGLLPGSFGKGPADMSGMDCFAAVIRHICGVTNREMVDFVAVNEALKFVMADFSAETAEKRNKVQEYRVATFEKVEQMVGKKNPTFEDIIECEEVRKNFWTHDHLLLFLPVLYQGRGDTYWQSMDDKMFEATNSLVKWPLQDYATVEEVLEKTTFGDAPFSSGAEVRFTFGKPAIVRLRLASKVDRDNWNGGNFSIEDVRCFSHNAVTRKAVWNPVTNKTDITESASQRQKDDVVYCLVAVVRLRNSNEDRDYARLYDFESQNILPHGNPGHFATFRNEFWSLGHLDHDHMLYYARADYRSINHIRSGMEFEDEEPDPESVRRNEELMDGLWQRMRARTKPPGSSPGPDKKNAYISP